MTNNERKQILKSLGMKYFYALKFTGRDASGVNHTFVATIDATSKNEAINKAKEEMKETGFEISKFNNVASFTDKGGAEWQANKWIQLLKERENETFEY